MRKKRPIHFPMTSWEFVVGDCHIPSGWFYEGGGIYRHVTMTVAEPVSILPWGVNAPSVIGDPSCSEPPLFTASP